MVVTTMIRNFELAMDCDRAAIKALQAILHDCPEAGVRDRCLEGITVAGRERLAQMSQLMLAVGE